MLFYTSLSICLCVPIHPFVQLLYSRLALCKYKYANMQHKSCPPWSGAVPEYEGHEGINHIVYKQSYIHVMYCTQG